MNSKYFILLLVIFSACGSPKNADDERILKEAAKIHLEAIEIEKEVKPKLDQLIQRKNQLSIQGRELTNEENTFIAKIDGIQASYDYWEKNHVEVEGGEHNHDHHGHDHHGHDHNHGPALDVLPKDMLIIQKEFRDSIVAIKSRVEAINF